MTYMALVSHRPAFLPLMDYQLSLYSQKADAEIAVFAYGNYAQLLQQLQTHPPLSHLFFDLEDPTYLAHLYAIKRTYPQLICVGVGRELGIDEQNKAFALGMDDCFTMPMSSTLLAIRIGALRLRPTVRTASITKKELESLPFDGEEIDEFDDLLKELHLQVLLMGKTEITEQDVYAFTVLLGKIESRFMTLVATFPLAHALYALCETIEANVEDFIALAPSLHGVALAFVNDLIIWEQAVLVQKNQKADFLNDSIIANAQTFAAMLDQSGMEEASTLDAIFNF